MPATTDLGRRLLAAADAATPEAERFLIDLIKFPTVNRRDTVADIERCKQECAKAFVFLEDWCRKAGFTWRNYDNLVAVAELPGSGPETVGFPLHIDVVPVNPADWTHPPFSGAIATDDLGRECIYGRGTQDDKGPSAAMLWAAKIARETGVPIRRTLKFIIGTTEETGTWECMKHYLKVEPAPDFSVVPDAEFPIINGEKGFITVVLKAKWATSDKGVPGGIELLKLASGDVENIVPDTATLDFEGGLKGGASLLTAAERVRQMEAETLPPKGLTAEVAAGGIKPATVESQTQGEFSQRHSMKIFGKACHASTPDKGVNAATLALRTLTSLYAGWEGGVARFARAILRATEGFNGKGMGIDVVHDFLGATTAALTVLRMTDDSGEARINIRHSFGITSPEVIAKVKAFVEQDEDASLLEFEVIPKSAGREPIYVDPAKFGTYLDALKFSYQDVQGREAKLMAIGGTTFAKAFPNAVCFGGVDEEDGEPSLAHQADERVAREHYRRNLRIYTLAMARLASGDNTLADTGDAPSA